MQHEKRSNLFRLCAVCGSKDASYVEEDTKNYCALCLKRSRLLKWGTEHKYPAIFCPRTVSDGMDYAIGEGISLWEVAAWLGTEKMIDAALKSVGLVIGMDDEL